MNFKKILPWLIGVIVIGVIIYYATKKKDFKKPSAIPPGTGIVPPGMVEYLEGDANLDGTVDSPQMDG